MASDNPKLTALASKHFHPLPIRNQQNAQLYHMQSTQRIGSKTQSLVTPLLLDALHLLHV